MENEMTFEEYMMLAYSHIGKEIEGYGKVEAITIYGNSHYGDRISFCFKDGKEWSETSASEFMNLELTN
jgi:hypothetical protein